MVTYRQRTAIALDFLSGGEDLENSDTLDFSACALYYSISGSTTGSACTDFTITSSSVTFTIPDTGATKDYNNVTPSIFRLHVLSHPKSYN